MSWRLADSLAVLRNEVNVRWPDRSKVSDGTLGDQAHAARQSDHNPNQYGVVRAMDITASGIEPDWYAEHLRKLGASGDKRLNPDGYVIWNRRIASSNRGWQWRIYTGTNPHDHHVHLSVTSDPHGYDLGGPWGVATAINPGELTVAQIDDLIRMIVSLEKHLDAQDARIAQLEKDRWKPDTIRGRENRAILADVATKLGVPVAPSEA